MTHMVKNLAESGPEGEELYSLLHLPFVVGCSVPEQEGKTTSHTI